MIISSFIVAVVCIVFIYYVIKIGSAIDQSIVRLQNVVNLLDERVKKLENHVFYTWDPHSDD